MFNKLSVVIVTFLIFSLTAACADEPTLKAKTLPEPLTLDLALSLIEQDHPNLRFANAGLQLSNSNLEQAISNNDLSINLRASGRWIEPSVLASNQEKEDHRAGIFVNKTLYDFGRSSSQIDAVNQQVLSQSLKYINAQQRQYIEVMQRYFNVVLSDLKFYRYNEEMAVAYIRFDRIQIREKLGQYTEVDVAEKKAEYERVRRLRTYSQNQQRVTRSLLAQALNRPNDLPSTVVNPKVDVTSRNIPDIEKMQKSVNEHNAVLKSLRAKLAEAKNNIAFAQASDNPTLSGGLEAYEYTRTTGSSDNWRAQITLDVPLWTGGRTDASVAKAKAAAYKVQAQLEQQEFAAKQQVLELCLSLETLAIKLEEKTAALDYTELLLDKNRALYELEVTSDLGYSMVKYSEAEREVVQTSFDIALAWAQLDALNGTLLNNINKTGVK